MSRERNVEPINGASVIPSREIRPRLAELRDRLVKMIGASAKSQRQIEDDLGWPHGQLGRILENEIDLRVEDVVAIVHAVGGEPADLFTERAPGGTK